MLEVGESSYCTRKPSSLSSSKSKGNCRQLVGQRMRNPPHKLHLLTVETTVILVEFGHCRGQKHSHPPAIFSQDSDLMSIQEATPQKMEQWGCGLQQR